MIISKFQIVVNHNPSFQLIIDSVSTRSANPTSSLLRKMVSKDGFDKNARMEAHEDADSSTASLVSGNDVNGDSSVTSDTSLSSEESEAPDEPTQVLAPTTSKTTAPTEPVSPTLASTPCPATMAPLEKPKADILTKLDQVHDLCSVTMTEVDTLKEKWGSLQQHNTRTLIDASKMVRTLSQKLDQVSSRVSLVESNTVGNDQPVPVSTMATSNFGKIESLTTEMARVNLKLTELENQLQNVPSSSRERLDLNSQSTLNWFKTKFLAHLKSPESRLYIKELAESKILSTQVKSF